MNIRRPHMVIFEPEVAGHPPFFIELLYKALVRQTSPFHVTFVVHPGIGKRLSSVEGISLRPHKHRIGFSYLDDAEIAACHHKVLWVRAVKRWSIMKRYLRRLEANHGLFLRLDHIQLPLALGLKPGGGCTVSGILFQPSTHNIYRSRFLTFKERIRNLRKRLLYRRMMCNASLDRIFSLDPYFAAEMQTCSHSGRKICHLPDPAPDAVEKPKRGAALPRSLNCLMAERKLFLMFGSLTKRKGVFELLEAIDGLDDKTAGGSLFVLAGKVALEVEHDLKTWISQYHRRKPDAAYIHLENRYLSNDAIRWLMNRADLVLAPYQRFVGSSGVLLWAAAAGKPVLTSSYGLVGKMARHYQLGWAVDTTRPDEIRCALEVLYADPSAFPHRTSGMDKLIRTHAPDLFSGEIMKYLNHLYRLSSVSDISSAEGILCGPQRREPIGG